MPVRRNYRPRRGDPEALAKVWCGILETGFDFFDEAAELGIRTNDAGQPDLAQARAAWRKYGRRIMAARDPALGMCWGEQVFGPPG